MVELPKFSRWLGNLGRGTRWWRQIFHRKWKYGRFAHAQCIRPLLLEQFVHYGRGYRADTTFHRTHFELPIKQRTATTVGRISVEGGGCAWVGLSLPSRYRLCTLRIREQSHNSLLINMSFFRLNRYFAYFHPKIKMVPINIKMNNSLSLKYQRDVWVHETFSYIVDVDLYSINSQGG